jgi:hypothetical protein
LWVEFLVEVILGIFPVIVDVRIVRVNMLIVSVGNDTSSFEGISLGAITIIGLMVVGVKVLVVAPFNG